MTKDKNTVNFEEKLKKKKEQLTPYQEEFQEAKEKVKKALDDSACFLYIGFDE